jgi:hypothetical protein
MLTNAESFIMLYYIFPSTQLQVIEITATCFDFNQSSFRRAYEPFLVTICFCAFGIPDGLQLSYAYNVILIYHFRVLGCVCTHIYLYLCYFSLSDFEEVTYMFSVFFYTWKINRILPNKGNLLCFVMLRAVVTDISSKLISFTESGKIRENTTWCILCFTQTCIIPQAILVEFLTQYLVCTQIFHFLTACV